MNPRQLNILMRAPKTLAEIAAEVAARLLGFSGRSIPVPKAMGIGIRQGKHPVPVLRLFGIRGAPQIWRGRASAKAPVVQPALRLAFDYLGHVAPACGADALRFREGDMIVTSNATWPQDLRLCKCSKAKVPLLRAGWNITALANRPGREIGSLQMKNGITCVSESLKPRLRHFGSWERVCRTFAPQGGGLSSGRLGRSN